VKNKGWQVVDGKMKYIPPKVEPLQRTSLDIPAPQDVVDRIEQAGKDFRAGRMP